MIQCYITNMPYTNLFDLYYVIGILCYNKFEILIQNCKLKRTTNYLYYFHRKPCSNVFLLQGNIFGIMLFLFGGEIGYGMVNSDE